MKELGTFKRLIGSHMWKRSWQTCSFECCTSVMKGVITLLVQLLLKRSSIRVVRSSTGGSGEMIIAVDFDGTIVEHAFPDIGSEVPGAVRTIQDLHKAGHSIIIWTCRTMARPQPGIEEMIAWLKRNNVPYDAINCNTFGACFYSMPKIYADMYIDDRNFGGFPGWDVVREHFLPGENGGGG